MLEGEGPTMLPERAEGMPQPELRVSDAERELVIAELRRHTGEGRLTLDEFADRAGEVYAANTGSQLDRVTADLPPTAVPSSRRRKAVRWTLSVMGGNARRGRWRIDGATTAVAVMGGTDLDLRDVEFEGGEIVVNALAVMGEVDIVVPEGVEVEVSGIAIMGGKDTQVRSVPIRRATPLVRVRAIALMGSVTVRSKASRSPLQLDPTSNPEGWV